MANDEATIDFPPMGGAMLIRKHGTLRVLVCQQAHGRQRWCVAFVLGVDALPEPAEVPALRRGGQQR